jgi:hypothetical protein
MLETTTTTVPLAPTVNDPSTAVPEGNWYQLQLPPFGPLPAMDAVAMGGPGSGRKGHTTPEGEASLPIPMHSVKVPKSGKLSIDQAHDAMKQMGYEPVGSYNGQEVFLNAVMTGAQNYQEVPREVADAHAAKWRKP